MLAFFAQLLRRRYSRRVSEPFPPSDPKLPTELLLKIFDHLDIDGLILASQVCRTWRGMAAAPELVSPFLRQLIPKADLLGLEEGNDLMQMLKAQRRAQINRAEGRFSVLDLPMEMGTNIETKLWITHDNRYVVSLADMRGDDQKIFTAYHIESKEVVFTKTLVGEHTGLILPKTNIFVGHNRLARDFDYVERLIYIDIDKREFFHEPIHLKPTIWRWKLVLNDHGAAVAVGDRERYPAWRSVESADGTVRFGYQIGCKPHPTPMCVSGAPDIYHQGQSFFGLASSATDNRYLVAAGYSAALLIDFDPRKHDEVSERGVYAAEFKANECCNRHWYAGRPSWEC
ncbi:unnamed protein product [Clonostachys byssicola]|uniref:F-box domain-containing protein n=1 Tax=Clonostachys byssicola TaxID=160290 RepID=A0A9N9ULJ1_9HYPO|nr:unnamed protein product [Clonostachys byssicola]